MFDHTSRVRHAALLFVATGLLATGVIAVAQQMPADLDPESGARLGYLTRQDLGDAGVRLSDIFAPNGDPMDPVSGPPSVGTLWIELRVLLSKTGFQSRSQHNSPDATFKINPARKQSTCFVTRHT